MSRSTTRSPSPMCSGTIRVPMGVKQRIELAIEILPEVVSIAKNLDTSSVWPASVKLNGTLTPLREALELHDISDKDERADASHITLQCLDVLVLSIDLDSIVTENQQWLPDNTDAERAKELCSELLKVIHDCGEAAEAARLALTGERSNGTPAASAPFEPEVTLPAPALAARVPALAAPAPALAVPAPALAVSRMTEDAVTALLGTATPPLSPTSSEAAESVRSANSAVVRIGKQTASSHGNHASRAAGKVMRNAVTSGSSSRGRSSVVVAVEKTKMAARSGLLPAAIPVGSFGRRGARGDNGARPPTHVKRSVLSSRSKTPPRRNVAAAVDRGAAHDNPAMAQAAPQPFVVDVAAVVPAERLAFKAEPALESVEPTPHMVATGADDAPILASADASSVQKTLFLSGYALEVVISVSSPPPPAALQDTHVDTSSFLGRTLGLAAGVAFFWR